MRIFVLGVPHTITSPRFWERCGFTEKVRSQCSMFKKEGHEVIHLGVEGSSPECTEHVDVMKADVWEKCFGKLWDLDINHPLFRKLDGPFEQYHLEWSKNVRRAIQNRYTYPRESVVLVTWGASQWWGVRNCEQLIVEGSIGYMDANADYRIYESYAWLHSHLGKHGLLTTPKWYWRVIPLSFDPLKFTPRKKKDYFLYFGRLDDAKGVQIAIDACKAAGRRLIICGYGDAARFTAPHVEYLPPCPAEMRSELLAEAQAVFCPTWYVEPFGRVAIEAMLSGTPVITTDWGAFTETVKPGLTGFRCGNMREFVNAVKNIEKINPEYCRSSAIDTYSEAVVGPQYTEYFSSLFRQWQDQ